jgi:hypothetical protein
MTTTIDIELKEGGSGAFGNGAYAGRATGCTEQARLSVEHPVPCADIYKETATGKPNAMLVGSLVHAMAEWDALAVEAIQPKEIVNFRCECGWVPYESAVKEGRRVYDGWVKIRKGWRDGKLKGVELRLDAVIDGVQMSALIDRLVEDPDGVLCLEDLKTSATSGDKHSKGRTRLQMHLYCIVAWANGFDVQRIRVRQIVKTREIKEEIFTTIDLPTPAREAWILRYLKGSLAREARGSDGPRGADCDYCRFAYNGLCRL